MGEELRKLADGRLERALSSKEGGSMDIESLRKLVRRSIVQDVDDLRRSSKERLLHASEPKPQELCLSMTMVEEDALLTTCFDTVHCAILVRITWWDFECHWIISALFLAKLAAND